MLAPVINPVFRIVAVRTVQASVLALVVHFALHWPWAGPHALGLFLTPALCLYFVFVFVAPWTWGPQFHGYPPHFGYAGGLGSAGDVLCSG